MEMIHFISQLYLIVNFLNDGDLSTTRQRIRDVYPNLSVYFPFAVWIFFIIFNVSALILLGQLYIFHTVLQYRNLTTYEHIVQDFRVQRSLARRKGDLDAERMETIMRAQEHRQTLKVWQLQLGGFCREIGCSYLDPLKLAPEPDEPDPEAGFANVLGSSSYGGETDNNDVKEYPDQLYGADYDDDENYDEGGEVTDNADQDRSENSTRSITVSQQNDGNDEGEKPDETKAITVSEQNGDSDGHTQGDTNDVTQQQEYTPTEYVEMSMSREGDGVVIDDALDDTCNLDLSNNDEAADDNDSEDNEYNEVQEVFLDEPDDRSHKSGCSGRSGRSYRSGRSARSGRSSKSGRSTHLGGDRDLTLF
jgi:hypothetical protein